MTSDQPSSGEMWRETQRLNTRVDRIEKDYVRKDVYEAKYSSAIQRVEDLEKANEQRERDAVNTRRQLLMLVAGIAIPAILGLLLSLYSILPSGATP